MYKVVRGINKAIDKILAILLILILLIGLYITADTLYVFYNASANRVAAYKPGLGNEDSRPFTEDYVAWVTLDQTKVDYPIMQGDTNEKYLNMNPFGEYSLSGSIFLDSRNSPDFSDEYSVTYGHHMENGLMFGALDDFYSADFFDEHQTGTLYVEDKQIPLQVFAVLETDARTDAIFEPGSSQGAVQLASGSSMHYRQPQSSHILALSTCIDATRTTRTVVLCSMSESL